MDSQSSYSELVVTIKNLNSEEKKRLSKVLSVNELNFFFYEMRQTIANEIQRRVHERIASTFISGYGNGALMNSIYTKIEGNSIVVSSTKNYFEILNKGFGAYDMKEAFLGKTVKMRLPGGRVIFRKCQDKSLKLSQNRKKAKNTFGSHNWWHPGYVGVDIYGQVEKEIQPWIDNYVKTKIEYLLNMAKGRENLFAMSNAGKKFWNKRNSFGRFSKYED